MPESKGIPCGGSSSPLKTPKVILKDPLTFDATENIKFRLYPDTRPRNLEIASLHKGIVLIANGSELIEEGAGFGVPIAKYSDHTVFCGTAKTYLKHLEPKEAIFKKIYFLDSVSNKEIQGLPINRHFYKFFHKTFEKAYINPKKAATPIFDSIMHIRKRIGVQTQFSKTHSKGKVTVSYHCLPDQIEVQVDLSEVDIALCKEFLILNEQGANYFRRYNDSVGANLCDNQVGAWTKIEAPKATFSCVNPKVSFTLEKKSNATLYRGREQIDDRFSWSGISYSVNPEVKCFSYLIRIEQNT